ncbi:MAG: type II secretion system protein [bacterium]|nr:type II secretion system protein [bacterium]
MRKFLLSTFYFLFSRKKGFTLIELVVAIGLFSIIVAIAIGGFIRALRTERQVIGLLAANSNASLAIEQMAREIRTGYDFCVMNGNSCGSSELSFRNANGLAVSYCLQDQGLFRGTGPGSCIGSTGNTITATNVLVQYLNFIVSGNQSTDGYPPRVTVAIGVSANTAGISGSIINLETTVSARVVDG